MPSWLVDSGASEALCEDVRRRAPGRGRPDGAGCSGMCFQCLVFWGKPPTSICGVEGGGFFGIKISGRVWIAAGWERQFMTMPNSPTPPPPRSDCAFARRHLQGAPSVGVDQKVLDMG